MYQIAKAQGITSKEALVVLRRAGVDVKVAASKVDAADAARAFSDPALLDLPPYLPAYQTTSQAPTAVATEPRKRLPRIRLDEFIARVEAEQPARLSVAEAARVSPPPWFTRNGSGKRARIRLPLGNEKFERMQGDQYWLRVDHWTMGRPR